MPPKPLRATAPAGGADADVSSPMVAPFAFPTSPHPPIRAYLRVKVSEKLQGALGGPPSSCLAWLAVPHRPPTIMQLTFTITRFIHALQARAARSIPFSMSNNVQECKDRPRKGLDGPGHPSRDRLAVPVLVTQL